MVQNGASLAPFCTIEALRDSDKVNRIFLHYLTYFKRSHYPRCITRIEDCVISMNIQTGKVGTLNSREKNVFEAF
jgi:hypothetical protein